MLSNLIKSEQLNTEIRYDSLVAFRYCTEGPSYVKS